MFLFALKMLMGDRAKYLGIVIGLSFASFIITQQSAIFVGIMARTVGFINDTSQPDIWVVDPKIQYLDEIKPMKDTDLYRVKSIEGVEWAVPMFRGQVTSRRVGDGTFKNCFVVGIDDATLIGGPPEMLEGRLEDVRMADAVIVNDIGANSKLAAIGADGELIPLRVGDVIELNDNRSYVAGICKVSRPFQSQPVVYTTYNRATSYAPRVRKMLSCILVKSLPGVSPQELSKRINCLTGLAAYPSDEFKELTISYYLKNTGISINFGVAVILGFIIGMAISGQTFYNFTLDNIRHFGTFKAMGATNKLLMQMILLQALVVAFIGWGIGVGGASLFGFLFRNTELSFKMPWQLLVLSGVGMLIICLTSAAFSIRRVFKLEPAIVFKS
jgi:putative ABC transport system permease protein